MSYQAIVFDLDGTLIDSERIWFRAYVEMCARFNKTYTGEQHAAMMGRSRTVNLRTFQEELGVPITEDDLQSVREAVTRKLFSEGSLVARKGVRSFVSALVDRGFILAVATASPAEYRDRALANVGIAQYFSGVISAEQVEHPKPAPDIYLAAAKHMGVDPAACLVVEDALAGVQAGVAAGMDVLGIRDVLFSRELPGAKKVIDSFDEITVSQIEAMSAK